MPTLSIESTRAEEADYLYFSVNLTEPASTDVLVDYQTHGLTAFDDSDFYETRGTLRFSAGETTKTIQVYAANDTLVERDEAFQIELSNPVGATFPFGKQSLQAIGWVLDTDVGGGQRGLAVSSPVVEEGRGVRAEFVLSVSEAFATSTTLTYSTFNGTAGNRDFAGRTGTVTFVAGQTEAIVPVAIRNDRAQEAAEIFGLKVTGGGLAAAGSATILNDDRPAPVLSLEGDSTHEGGYATFTARLSKPAAFDATVGYQTFGGTATSAVDFYDTNGTLTFSAGETVQTIRVYAPNDNLGEPDEAFQLELFNPVGAVFGARNASLHATGWVIDEDAGGGQRAVAGVGPGDRRGQGRRVLHRQPLGGVHQQYRAHLRHRRRLGARRQGLRRPRRPGRLRRRSDRGPGRRRAARRSRASRARRPSASRFGAPASAGYGEAHILDDDAARPIASVESSIAAEGRYETFAVRLSEASKSEVTVGYEALSRSALAGNDFYATSGRLTFAAGETEKTVRGLCRQRQYLGAGRVLRLPPLEPGRRALRARRPAADGDGDDPRRRSGDFRSG